MDRLTQRQPNEQEQLLLVITDLLVSYDNWQVPGDCGGCGRPIYDRYYLEALGKVWHVVDCLRCVSCLQSLDTQHSCFVRAGLVYCRADYHRSVTQTHSQHCIWRVQNSESSGHIRAVHDNNVEEQLFTWDNVHWLFVVYKNLYSPSNW